ncbi:phytanoyl dioxygenase [Triangularia verruculosa]|uniref:Phytanoyl dioxygenase n=1 Tax=Triangularia verruculosa TaxID=2587418 RepID=A0AAN7ATU2_9PEZI|nr:phytanoyl dioxygenase [Triangularia verruculosa]
MPRILNKAGDEALPVCARCLSAGRFCDRSSRPLRMRPHGENRRITTSNLPSPADPRGALSSGDNARLYQHYITTIAPWYDLSDESAIFSTELPRLALDSPLLFSAILALSAMQTSNTISPSTKAVAEFYHSHCVRLLIAFDSNADFAQREITLAAACLLRTYEIQDEETDPIRHLQGAFSLASSYLPGTHETEYPILAAGFWNYLREDITHGLFEHRPLKMDVSTLSPPKESPADQTWLNAVSLILGQILSCYMHQSPRGPVWRRLRHSDAVPGQHFPSVWMLRDCHAAVRHYDLVSLYLLGDVATTTDFEDVLALEPAGPGSEDDFLEWCALEIVGIAFTSGSHAVIVNAFGPIAFCSRSSRSAAAQQELVRLLNPCAKTIGWPIQRMITNLALFYQSRYLATIINNKRPLNGPHVIRPSQTEQLSGQLSPRNFEAAVRHIHRDGLVVVEDVAPLADLDHLNTKMVQDARNLQARGENGPFNYSLGNLQLDAPPVAEYFSNSIFTNPVASQITSHVLGPRPKWTFCSANAATPPLPGGTPQRQPVHSDADFAHPSHPFALVVNIPLVTMTPENGSTELWLGTHARGVEAQEGAHGERASGRIKQALLDERAKVRGPCQPTVKKGSIVLRDLRLWHAGMPNKSEEVRIMLAMIHFAPWYRNRMRMEFGEDVKPLLQERGPENVEAVVDWVTRDEVVGRYLDRGFGNMCDFDQEL